MDLLLWRHAEADDGADDYSRPLTERGRKQAASVAAWLTQHLPRQLRIIASPTVRTCQTAEALGLPFQVEAGVGPESGTPDMLATIGWPPARGSVLLIGHQPGLGRLASLLLGGQEADWSIKKGSLWWLSRRVREGEPQTVLRTVIAPDFLRSK